MMPIVRMVMISDTVIILNKFIFGVDTQFSYLVSKFMEKVNFVFFGGNFC